MKVHRYGRLGGVLLAGSLALAACGSDDNTVAAASPAPAQTSEPAPTPTPSAAASGSTPPECAGGTLNAEGSSAQGNAMSTWISKYQAKCSGTTINYGSTGSGAGVKQFIAGQVDFGGSDSALKEEEVGPAKDRCNGNDAWNLPMAIGPIAVAYKLADVSDLVLDGATVAKIFTGKVTKWNDQAIKDLNSGMELPDKDIKVFFRADESGTTDNFLKYLKAAGGEQYSGTPSKKFDGGVGEGKPQSAGVQQAVAAGDGGITYVEYSFAKDANLSIAKIKTGGDPVGLSPESAGKALDAATAAGSGNDLKLTLDYATTADGAYPIVLVTYQLVCSKGLDQQKTDLLRSFLAYVASSAGQNDVGGIGYGTLPSALQSKVAAAIAAIAS